MTTALPPTAPLRLDRALAPLRVTVVTPYASLGGSERWLLGLLDTAGDRLEVEVWLLEDGPLVAELDDRGVTARILPTGTSAAAIAGRTLSLAARLRRSRADVVLANGVKAALAVVPAARATGVKVCWAKHDFSWDHELGRVLGRASDAVLSTSAAVAAATGRDDAVLVPPPRPEPAADRDTARRFWATRGVPLDQGPVVAMLTRLVAYKGVDTALHALASGDGLVWRLVVAGPADPTEPGEQARLTALATELGVADRVSFLGEVADAGRHLAAFDAVAVLTRPDGSRFGREGYSIVALEALTAGVPLIGAAGNPEVERMALTAGCVVRPRDHVAAARALRDVRDPEVAERCRSAGAEVIAHHPDAAACAERVVAALSRVAQRPGAGTGAGTARDDVHGSVTGPPITVLSSFKDEEGHVDGVVSAVLDQLGPDDEYLVVDDVSDDKTGVELAVWAGRDARVRVLDGPGINLSAARNAGFAAARHAHVACTDAGCLPSPTWLAALRAPFAEPDPVDLVVGVYDLDGGDPRRDACRVALFPSVEESRRTTPLVWLSGRLTGRRFDVRRLDGRSMACTVAAWERAGGFDVRLSSSEDAVFGEAVLASGGTSALALDAAVTWAQWDSWSDMVRTYARYGEWGGRAGSWPLVRRDLVRGAAYVVAPVVLARGPGLARAAVVAGAAGYLALPLRRLVAEQGRHLDPATVALVPVVMGLKDVMKAWGCLRGTLARHRERSGRGSDTR